MGICSAHVLGLPALATLRIMAELFNGQQKPGINDRKPDVQIVLVKACVWNVPRGRVGPAWWMPVYTILIRCQDVNGETHPGLDVGVPRPG